MQLGYIRKVTTARHNCPVAHCQYYCQYQGGVIILYRLLFNCLSSSERVESAPFGFSIFSITLFVFALAAPLLNELADGLIDCYYTGVGRGTAAEAQNSRIFGVSI